MGTIKYSVELVRRTIYKAHHPTAAQQYGHFFYIPFCLWTRTYKYKQTKNDRENMRKKSHIHWQMMFREKKKTKKKNGETRNSGTMSNMSLAVVVEMNVSDWI